MPVAASQAAYTAAGTYPAAMLPGLMSAADHIAATNFGVVPTHASAALFASSQKAARTDRLEV